MADSQSAKCLSFNIIILPTFCTNLIANKEDINKNCCSERVHKHCMLTKLPFEFVICALNVHIEYVATVILVSK